MNVIHEQVIHRRFGIGTIINQTENTVSVEFGEEHGVKKFIYPLGFKNFLTLTNAETQNKMDEVLRQK